MQTVLRRVPRPSFVAALVYLALAFTVADYLPLVEIEMFKFRVPERASVAPLFLVDGKPAHVEDFEGFQGLPPDVVDVGHEGFECSVEHKLHEQHAWLSSHQAPPGAIPGPVRVSLGVRILSLAEDGRVQVEERIDARGTAHKLSP